MNREGFSLVECMTYCCIMMSLSFFATEFFSKNYRQLASYIKKNNQLMCVYTAHDALHNDILYASDNSDDWIEKTNELICKTMQADVAWRLKDHSLYRSSGVYDYERKKWHKKNTALIAHQITQFTYMVEKKGDRVVSVQRTIGIEDMEPISTCSWISQRIIQ